MSVYYNQSIYLVSIATKELGKTGDYNKYCVKKEKIYSVFLDEYFSPNGKLSINTQTPYVLSLFYKIYRKKGHIWKDFKKRITIDSFKMKTGFTGTVR